jgi:hypothetical protein
VRGGALPLLAWAALLFVLAVGDAVWEQKVVNAATAFFAVLAILAAAGAIFAAGGRRVVRRGPPEPATGPEPVPQASLGAVLIALSVAMVLFGMAWARFLVYFGLVCLLAALGRMSVELRAERRALRRARGER